MTRLDGRINSTIYSNLKNFLISINYFECNRFFLKVVIFGSVRLLLKIKVTKQIFLKKKPKPVPTDRFRFGFLEKNRFKPVWFGFSV